MFYEIGAPKFLGLFRRCQMVVRSVVGGGRGGSSVSRGVKGCDGGSRCGGCLGVFEYV